MKVIMISPGFPDEMPLFTQALARVGAQVAGVGDQPQRALEPRVRAALGAYLQIPNLWDEQAAVAEVTRWVGRQTIDRVECLWEPGMLLAARLRQELGVPGLSYPQAVAFRDKQRMKEVLDAAGIRTPYHYRARTQKDCREAAEQVGFPLIVKPIDGAGSADTYRIDEPAELEQVFPLLGHVPEVSVEEYIEGEEYTFDTICAGGHVAFENVAWYRPKPLVARLNEWISPQAVCLAELDAEDIAPGRALGRRVLEALGFESGFSHMEWFRTPAGEAVFGEIGGRPPGGRLVHVMNYANNCDLFTGWAQASCHGTFPAPQGERFNTAVVFKRAHGQGVIQRYDGLDNLLARFGEHVVHLDLVPLGAPRRDWRQVVSGDGWIVVRHPALDECLAMADAVGLDLKIIAA